MVLQPHRRAVFLASGAVTKFIYHPGTSLRVLHNRQSIATGHIFHQGHPAHIANGFKQIQAFLLGEFGLAAFVCANYRI